MKPLSGMRPATKAAGDDITLTRFVRVGREDHKPRKLQPRLPGTRAAYAEEGRTKFPTRVIPVSDMTTLLVSGHSNIKIGRDVRKGKFRGYWIYTLSLEERKTCPSSCLHWESCYGNSMPFAKRINHLDAEFLPRLDAEIAKLVATRGREGILIRLHALGDFYSVAYVDFWHEQLVKHPTLAVYGYTARHPREGEIGEAIEATWLAHKDRFMVRQSSGRDMNMSTVAIASVESRPADAFVCPEQTGQTRCCATCGACWSTTKNVAFLDH